MAGCNDDFKMKNCSDLQELYESLGFQDKNDNCIIEKQSFFGAWRDEGYDKAAAADINGDGKLVPAEVRYYLHQILKDANPQIRIAHPLLSEDYKFLHPFLRESDKIAVYTDLYENGFDPVQNLGDVEKIKIYSAIGLAMSKKGVAKEEVANLYFVLLNVYSGKFADPQLQHGRLENDILDGLLEAKILPELMKQGDTKTHKPLFLLSGLLSNVNWKQVSNSDLIRIFKFIVDTKYENDTAIYYAPSSSGASGRVTLNLILTEIVKRNQISEALTIINETHGGKYLFRLAVKMVEEKKREPEALGIIKNAYSWLSNGDVEDGYSGMFSVWGAFTLEKELEIANTVENKSIRVNLLIEIASLRKRHIIHSIKDTTEADYKNTDEDVDKIYCEVIKTAHQIEDGGTRICILKELMIKFLNMILDCQPPEITFNHYKKYLDLILSREEGRVELVQDLLERVQTCPIERLLNTTETSTFILVDLMERKVEELNVWNHYWRENYFRPVYGAVEIIGNMASSLKSQQDKKLSGSGADEDLTRKLRSIQKIAVPHIANLLKFENPRQGVDYGYAYIVYPMRKVLLKALVDIGEPLAIPAIKKCGTIDYHSPYNGEYYSIARDKQWAIENLSR